MSMEVRLLVFAGLVPGFVTGLTMLGAWLWHGKRTRRAHESGKSVGRGPVWLAPQLLAAAFVPAVYAFDAVVGWSNDITKRYPHAMALAGVAGVLTALLGQTCPWRRTVLTVVRALAFGGMAWMLIEGIRPDLLPRVEMWGWVAVAAVGGAGWAGAGEAAAGRARGWALAFVSAALGGGLMGAMFLGNFAPGTNMLVAVVAVSTAAGVAGLIARRVVLADGFATVLVGVVVLMLCGVGIQTEPVSAAALALVAVSPVALVLAGNKRGWLGLVLGVVGVAVTLGPAVVILQRTSEAAAEALGW